MPWPPVLHADMTIVRGVLAAFFVLVLCMAAFGQANPTCATRPKTLSAMQDCYRSLLVFSPRADDPRLGEQSKILDADADDMMDRFVMLTPVLTVSKGYATPLDAPYVLFGAPEMKDIRARFHVPESRFLVLLLDEDGGVMLRSDRPVDPDRLNALIDTMPMRKIERERPHAN